MKNVLAGITGLLMLNTLLADERRLALAFARWERQPSLVSALHVATSGLFLARDLGALG